MIYLYYISTCFVNLSVITIIDFASTRFDLSLVLPSLCLGSKSSCNLVCLYLMHILRFYVGINHIPITIRILDPNEWKKSIVSRPYKASFLVVDK
uniref:Uncharacterized protein n=1 Tax=Lepeophtheirus salmonis TaxID=72036 RepID=A0A0K2T1Z7_LEPSM